MFFVRVFTLLDYLDKTRGADSYGKLQEMDQTVLK